MHTASTNSTMRIWHLGPVTPRPTFLFSAHLRVTKLPGPDTTRSSQGQHRRMERAAGKNDRKCLRKQLTRQDASESVGHAAQVQSSTVPHTTPRLPRSALSALHLSAQCERLPVLHCCLTCSTCLSGNTWSALSSSFRDVLMRLGFVSMSPCQRCWTVP